MTNDQEKRVSSLLFQGDKNKNIPYFKLLPIAVVTGNW